ncbi:aminopeptidase N [Stieleria varia]|uniref:Aminopeptidase N n=1 Tax=Stieleria varia TaxID=2528005 RepID=A0A5C6B3G2_9BACT|nr:aminopeptidase N [Stieleria varia]TWU05816.1 Aminopeptidase N [Stieleria varia]
MSESSPTETETETPSETQSVRTVYRKDYTPPNFWVDHVDLQFDLQPNETYVSAQLRVRRNQDQPPGPLQLDGNHLQLQSVAVDGRTLSSTEYQLTTGGLILTDLPEECVVETRVVIDPESNKALSGLYRTSGNYCTQCEAQGFRRITFFPDRPDVMSRYRVTIRGEKTQCPVMLSNGNRLSQSDLQDGRHEVIWEDPFPKPSYLFALVAGDLKCHRGSFTTRSGREVALEIWVEERNLSQCEHALVSLQKSMRWDEDVFGLEYDLDIYMIVAVDDFNMGAMENKGLNVFNSKFVLALPETATDSDFLGVEAVIAHEYFHNWTGNRVTCRDWFQLTLKEGLTVFRDQQFTTDQTSAAVKRIDDVVSLRGRQFAEDSGPMAHPIRPESYIAMDNFYTATVYDKGAEIIRMYHTQLGAEGFRRGMDLYFQRHDNSAVTCDDFRAAMADANKVDFTLMDRWYSQAGTPDLTVDDQWDADSGQYTLTFTQSYPPLPESIPGVSGRQPVPIPIRTALLDSNGDEFPMQLTGEIPHPTNERVLMLNDTQRSFVFTGLSQRPVPSVLRGYSAPVRLRMQRDDEQLAFLMAHDNDSFNRWDAGQTLALRLLVSYAQGEDLSGSDSLTRFLDAIGQQTSDTTLDGSYLALLLTLPSESTIAQEMKSVDPDAIHSSRQFLRAQIAARHGNWLAETYRKLAQSGPYRNDPASIDGRRLKNTALAYLTLDRDTLGPDEKSAELAANQYDSADNMTDRQAALSLLCDLGGPKCEAALADFYDRYHGMPLVLDKWFTVQALSSAESTLTHVIKLTEHPDFDLTNPNRVRSLLQAFTMNQVRFHRPDGGGYQLLTDHVLMIDRQNPQLASRLVSRLNDYRRLEPVRQGLMREQLERINASKSLSNDVREIVTRALEF